MTLRGGTALAELRQRAQPRGGSKRLAYELGVSKSTISNWISGRHPITDFRAEQILAKVREEELRLLARLEAEMQVPWPWREH